MSSTTMRARKTELSPKQIVNDLSYLGIHVTGFFQLQNSIYNIFNWENHVQTFLFLIIASFTCFYPIMIFILPLIYFNVFILIPRYCTTMTLKPSKNVHLTKDSLIDVIIDKIMEKISLYVFQQQNRQTEQNLGTQKNKQKTVNEEQQREEEEEEEEGEEENHKNLEFIINLKDLQKFIHSTVHILKKLEKLVFKNDALAKDRIMAILLSQLITTAIIVLYFLSNIINWSFMFLFMLWATVLYKHPLIICIKNFKKETKKTKSKTNQKHKSVLRNSISKLFTFIHPNTAEELDYVQIYEIQHRDHSNSEWVPTIYTLSAQEVYLNSLHNNEKKNYHIKGVKSLSFVLPPEKYTYLPNSKWEYNNDESSLVLNWLMDQNIPINDLIVSKDQGERYKGFVYLNHNSNIRMRKLHREVVLIS